MANKTKNTPKAKANGVGRPAYEPIYPRTNHFTFYDWCEANEVNINRKSDKFGKGPNCSMLTLRKHLAADQANGKNSVIMLVEGTLAEPASKSGLGRKQFVYALRNGVPARSTPPARKSTPRKATAKNSGDVSQTPTADTLDKIHEILATPAVTIVPEPTPAPATETPAPVVAETTPEPAPAPAPETVTAPAPAEVVPA
jgi:hypothetical protein